MLCILLTTNSQLAHATEWYDYNYELPYFSYKAKQLLGSEAKHPDMFPVAVKLNTYVKQKIDDGTLKNKPVRYTIYDIDNTNITRKRFCLEIYETSNAYYINVNWGLDFMVYFSYEELVKTIDYFAHPDFKPFYCSPLSEIPTSSKTYPVDLAMDIFFRNIKPLIGLNVRRQNDDETYDVYEVDSLKIQYICGEFRIRWADEDLGIVLNYPVSIPVKFKDRILFADNEYLYIFENGKNIKTVKNKDIGFLWECEIQEESTRLKVQIYDGWLNICNYDDKPIYSYSYKNNWFYVL